MPVDQETVVNISCDNPDCPGHDLDPAERTGWLFVSHEVYGQPVAQHVFGDYQCMSAGAAATDEDGDPLLAATAPQPPTPA